MRRIRCLLCLLLVAGCGNKGREYVPGPTLKDDLAGLEFSIQPAYLNRHPRLLFYGADKADLQRKKDKAPRMWDIVTATADTFLLRLPDEEGIRKGRAYYFIGAVSAGALSWYLDGNEKHKEQAVTWMVDHCKVDTWGVGWNENVDLVASHYLYHISLAYDILYDQLTAEQRTVVRDGLRGHARAVHEHVVNLTADSVRYDQNHTYIPVIASVIAGLVLYDDVPEAAEWVKYGYAVMRRCRAVLGDDGYYYEGVSYWAYALHWHVRYADLMGRATGEDLYDLPQFRKNHLFAMHTLFPGGTGSFDIGDGGGSTGNASMLFGIARSLQDPVTQAAGLERAVNIEGISPATDAFSNFMWYDPDLKPADRKTVKPYVHFEDHDNVFWRSGWGADATACVFKCGPSLGHGAAAKFGFMKDWVQNDGHTHPDIGSFLWYAGGKYRAVDTGYLYKKRTMDHNGILIDGQGMANDGSYWVYRKRPFERFDGARIEDTHLCDEFAYARGDFSSVYTDIDGTFGIKRHVLACKEYLLVLDDLSAKAPRTFSWLLHSNSPLERRGYGFGTDDGFAVHCLLPADGKAVSGPHEVLRGSPPHEPKPAMAGHLLRIDTGGPVRRATFLNVLAVGAGDDRPDIRVWAADDAHCCVSVKGADYADVLGVAFGGDGGGRAVNPADGNASFSWQGAYGFVRRTGNETLTAGTPDVHATE